MPRSCHVVESNYPASFSKNGKNHTRCVFVCFRCKAALLPQMRAIGDMDSEMSEFMRLTNGAGSDIPPAISTLDRQFLLAAQIRKFPIGGILPTAAQALSLAESLASLMISFMVLEQNCLNCTLFCQKI